MPEITRETVYNMPLSDLISYVEDIAELTNTPELLGITDRLEAISGDLTLSTPPENTDIGYMCQTDFQHELYNARGGVTVYPSPENAKQCRECIEDCGMVSVKVELVEVIDKGTI
jgi:NAD-dependent dihydropyrimidine dehydrogenase PreA subunit